MATDENVKTDDRTFAPKCIWCSAPWSDENVRVYDFDAADECESGRFGPEEVSVSIVCHACNKEMYSKRAENDYGAPYSWRGFNHPSA